MGEKVASTNADKAREAAALGQELKEKGFTHTQSSNAASHELKHALADKGPGQFSLQHQDDLTVPTYSSIGSRTAQEKLEIALAPKTDASPADIKVAAEAVKEIQKK